MYAKTYLWQAAVAVFLSLQGRSLGTAEGGGKGGCCLQSSFRYVEERKFFLFLFFLSQLPKVPDRDHCEGSGYKSPADFCLGSEKRNKQLFMIKMNNFLCIKTQPPQTVTFLVLSLKIDQS